MALALAALASSSTAAEIIVVDDGSSPETAAVLEHHRVVVVRHDRPKGRSAARNAGALRASGDVLLFLDGDVLADPELVERHAAAHRRESAILGRGEQYHLRCTRFFLDPRTGIPMPGHEARVARMGAELARSLVTEAQIREDFASIASRAEVGIYPGSGPRLLAEVELADLRERPDSRVSWVAASGHNFSVPRALFVEAGGYDPDISINEHRELALRIGAQVRLVEGARSYHLTHRVGWRDPLEDREWEQRFWAKHPIPAVALLSVFWRSLANDPLIPAAARLATLADLERAARGDHAYDFDALRRAHPGLGPLS